MTDHTPSGPESHPSGLLRTLGVWSAASIVVGTIIGSGIFIVPKTMVSEVGTPGMVFAVFVFGGLLSLAGALTYAELGAALPHAGGEYVFLSKSYGEMWGFLYGWTSFFIAKSAGIAALATAFAIYLGNFFPVLDRPFLSFGADSATGQALIDFRPGQFVAIAMIALLAGINYLGVRLGARVQVSVTVLKVVLILAIVGFAALLGPGSTGNFNSSVAHRGGFAGFVAALVAALWAYDGWNNLTMVSGELSDPQRSIPRALILGVLGVMGIYLLANASYFYVLSAEQVAATDRVAGEAARTFLGSAGSGAVSIAAMISIFAALNGSILSGARVPFAMAYDGLFVSAMKKVHPNFRTPHVAIVALSAVGAVLVLTGRYDDLFTLVIFASWILYGMTAASVFVLRRKRPDLHRPYRTLGYPLVPALFVLAALVLVVTTLYNTPWRSVFGLFLIASGIPFYLRWKRQKTSIPAPAALE